MDYKRAITKTYIALSLVSMTHGSIAVESINDKTQQDKTETIEVLSNKPLSFYQKQLEKAEYRFYDAFNDLVEHPKYKIKCKKVPVSQGSRVTKKACYPQYFLAKKTQLIETAIRAEYSQPTDQYVEFMVKKDKAYSLAYAEELAEKNPQLKQRIKEMHQARQAYLLKIKQKDS